MITVRELIAELQKLDLGLLVVLSSDPEGNRYKPLMPRLETCSAFHPKHEEVKLRGPLTRELDRQGYAREDIAGPGYVPCVVLYPE